MSVTVYSTPTCPWCTKTKEFLTQQKIKFKDIDVSTDEKAAQDMVKKSGQRGVPVIDANGEIIIGFDVDALRAALKIK